MDLSILQQDLITVAAACLRDPIVVNPERRRNADGTETDAITVDVSYGTYRFTTDGITVAVERDGAEFGPNGTILYTEPVCRGSAIDAITTVLVAITQHNLYEIAMGEAMARQIEDDQNMGVY